MSDLEYIICNGCGMWFATDEAYAAHACCQEQDKNKCPQCNQILGQDSTGAWVCMCGYRRDVQ